MNNFPLSLHRNTIDIWEISLSLPISEISVNYLSIDEQTRFQRFYFEKHRRRFASARIALRYILGHYLQQTPASLEFAYAAYGKPSLQHFPQLQFNLTHSKDLALLAICQDHPIGIDIEFFSARPFQGIAGHLFSLKEQQQLEQLPPGLTPLGFFSTWAQKEAVMKAIGVGMSYPTKDIDLHLLPTTSYSLYEPQTKQHLQLTPFMPQPASCAAVCYHPDLTEIRYFHYDPTVQLSHLQCVQHFPGTHFGASRLSNHLS